MVFFVLEMTRLSTRGQIVIPKKMREQLNLQPGEHLAIETNQGQIVLRRLSKEILSTQAAAESDAAWQEYTTGRDKGEPLDKVRRELLEDAGV